MSRSIATRSASHSISSRAGAVLVTFGWRSAPYRAGSPDAAVDLIDQNFFGGEMPLVTRTALLTYIKAATFTDTRVREAIGLAISSNAFQWY